MKIRINESTIAEGSISKIGRNMLHVKCKAAEAGAQIIEVLSDNDDSVIAKYEGFETVFKALPDGVVLSNDGSVETIITETEGEDIQQIRSAKLAEVSSRCESTIYSGTDVTFADGTTEHFSLTEKDQINMFGKQAQLAAGATQLEYHEDGQLCKYYTAADMTTIIATAMQFVSYHTTYCNSLNAWIKGETDQEKLKAITYGDAIPTKYQSEVLKQYIASEA